MFARWSREPWRRILAADPDGGKQREREKERKREREREGGKESVGANDCGRIYSGSGSRRMLISPSEGIH